MMHGPSTDNLTLRGYCVSRDAETMRLFIARREGLYRYRPSSLVSFKFQREVKSEKNNYLHKYCRVYTSNSHSYNEYYFL